jgi:hypothetical protein
MTLIADIYSGTASLHERVLLWLLFAISRRSAPSLSQTVLKDFIRVLATNPFQKSFGSFLAGIESEVALLKIVEGNFNGAPLNLQIPDFAPIQGLKFIINDLRHS